MSNMSMYPAMMSAYGGQGGYPNMPPGMAFAGPAVGFRNMPGQPPSPSSNPALNPSIGAPAGGWPNMPPGMAFAGPAVGYRNMQPPGGQGQPGAPQPAGMNPQPAMPQRTPNFQGGSGGFSMQNFPALMAAYRQQPGQVPGATPQAAQQSRPMSPMPQPSAPPTGSPPSPSPTPSPGAANPGFTPGAQGFGALGAQGPLNFNTATGMAPGSQMAMGTARGGSNNYGFGFTNPGQSAQAAAQSLQFGLAPNGQMGGPQGAPQPGMLNPAMFGGPNAMGIRRPMGFNPAQNAAAASNPGGYRV